MTNHKLLIASVLLTLLTACSTTSESSVRSRFGESVGTRYPAVSLISGSFGDGTGVLLGPNLLLTVNHVSEGNQNAVRVYPNYSPTAAPREVKASDIKFNGTDPRVELSLVKLAQAVSGPYSSLSSTAASDNQLFAVGYGINTGTSTTSKAKLKAEVRLRGYRGVPTDIDDPSVSKADSNNLLMGELEPGPNNQLPCAGDRGGPVYQRKNGEDVVVGVLSHIVRGPNPSANADAFSYCREGVYARFVPAHHYRAWLDRTASQMGTSINWVSLGGAVSPPGPVNTLATVGAADST